MRRLQHALSRADGHPLAEVAGRRWRVAHRAVLLFPATIDSALASFAAQGLDPVAPVPSVLVRRRLCDRYGLEPDACDVWVTRLRTPSSTGGHNLEVFLFPKTAPALEPGIVDAERAFGYEDHLAVEVDDADAPALERLIALFQEADLLFEGGGHNPYEGALGTTVLYFVARTLRTRRMESAFERVELSCRGDFTSVVERHPVDDEAVHGAYRAWSGVAPRAA